MRFIRVSLTCSYEEYLLTGACPLSCAPMIFSIQTMSYHLPQLFLHGLVELFTKAMPAGIVIQIDRHLAGPVG